MGFCKKKFHSFNVTVLCFSLKNLFGYKHGISRGRKLETQNPSTKSTVTDLPPHAIFLTFQPPAEKQIFLSLTCFPILSECIIYVLPS